MSKDVLSILYNNGTLTGNGLIMLEIMLIEQSLQNQKKKKIKKGKIDK